MQKTVSYKPSVLICADIIKNVHKIFITLFTTQGIIYWVYFLPITVFWSFTEDLNKLFSRLWGSCLATISRRLSCIYYLTLDSSLSYPTHSLKEFMQFSRYILLYLLFWTCPLNVKFSKDAVHIMRPKISTVSVWSKVTFSFAFCLNLYSCSSILSILL